MHIFNQLIMWQQLNSQKHADMVKRFSCLSNGRVAECGRNVIEVTLTVIVGARQGGLSIFFDFHAQQSLVDRQQQQNT